eukprot:CAMPEP_0198425322 /NCGR_PEP_ID=MMETSP1452-20131203/4447_1 /TAXON_ID=1181717 /ORGANISM="Synchroma pusillum, Strain CCMP3072" /LENGTH=213 /DNA_ID=CAMNT_0044145677 /DNA_START=79 /DNA_END=720 /DNA_ORIENTATION=+
MIRALVAAIAITGATAFFTPAAAGARRAGPLSMSKDFAGGLNGVATEIGSAGFDPLELARTADEETLLWYRAAELKHGRVCMLASAGLIVQGLYTLPDPVFSETNPFAAVVKVYNERPGAWLQIGLVIAAVEVLGASIQQYTAPGDLGWDPLGLKPEDPEEFEELQLKELKNGSLAMLATAGMMTQSYLTGQSPVEQLTSGHISPFGDGQGFF